MRPEAIGIVAVCALACAGTALATPDTLSGNRQGMRVAEHVMHAFARIPGYTFTETRFFQMATTGGKSPSLHYRFGYGSLPSGWSWANEKGAMALSDNHIVWWRDDLSPVSKRAQPVELVFNGNGKFWAFGTAAHHGCFRALTSASEMPYDRGFVITGKVQAPRKQGGSISLTYSYPWATTSATATETDVIARSSYLVNSGIVSVGSYSFGFADYFSGSGPAPAVHRCK